MYMVLPHWLKSMQKHLVFYDHQRFCFWKLSKSTIQTMFYHHFISLWATYKLLFTSFICIHKLYVLSFKITYFNFQISVLHLSASCPKCSHKMPINLTKGHYWYELTMSNVQLMSWICHAKLHLLWKYQHMFWKYQIRKLAA